MSEIHPIEASLVKVFSPKHSKAALEHFIATTQGFQKGNWESSILKGGKFVEAVLKMLYLYVGNPSLPPARQFKVSNIIINLKNIPVGTFSDTLRITIPRACEFVYDIASNRGARHDPDEVDPNEMDATIMLATISWVLAELIRYSQKGSIDQSLVNQQIQSLIQRRSPQIEKVGPRTYFHLNAISGRQIALLTLWEQHPKRLSKDDLISAITRHGFTIDNAKTSINRILSVVDIDDDGNYRLLSPGLIEAEEIMKRNN